MAGVILIFVAVLVVYVISYYRWAFKYPKGPLPLPIIGNLLQMPLKNPHLWFEDLAKKHGHAFTVFLPHPHVVFTDYDHIKEAFVNQGETFAGRTKLPPETLHQLGPQKGLLVSDGEVWRAQRRVSLQILRDFGMGKNIMEMKVKRSIEDMLLHLDEIEDKNKVDIFLPVHLCIGNVINEILFGYHYSHKNCAKFEHFVAIVSKHLRMLKDSRSATLIEAFPWMRYLPVVGRYGYTNILQHVRSYYDFIESEVKEQLATFNENSEPQNFVHAYLREMKQRKDPYLNLEQLCGVMVDFWLAGMETTSITTRWALLYFQKYPEVQQKVQREIDRVVGRDRLPCLAHRPNMPYTQAVIHEVQRHSCIVSFTPKHRCTQDTCVLGKHVPKDSFVYGQIHAALAFDKIFVKPEKFWPERFLNEDGKTINKDLTDRLIIFGMGKRICVGEGLARAELFLILTSLLQRYSFSSENPDMEPVSGMVLPPKRQICTVTARY